MKRIITTAAAARVWFAAAGPGPAAAFTSSSGGSGLQIEITIGSQRVDRFAGRGHDYNRPRDRRRLPGFGFYRGGHNGPSYYGRGYYGPGNYDRSYNGGGYRLPARAIIRSLRALHFYRILYPQFRNGLYHTRARDAQGRRVRLAIDPYSGRIVRHRFRF